MKIFHLQTLFKKKKKLKLSSECWMNNGDNIEIKSIIRITQKNKKNWRRFEIKRWRNAKEFAIGKSWLTLSGCYPNFEARIKAGFMVFLKNISFFLLHSMYRKWQATNKKRNRKKSRRLNNECAWFISIINWKNFNWKSHYIDIDIAVEVLNSACRFVNWW